MYYSETKTSKKLINVYVASLKYLRNNKNTFVTL